MTIALTKPAAGSTTWGTTVNQNFTDVETTLNERLQDLPGLYGDASEPITTIMGGTTTLTRDMYYPTLTVTSTGVLNTAGFRVYAKTSVTVDAGGVISNDANGIAAALQGTVGGGGAGAGAGGAGTSTDYSLGGAGGDGNGGGVGSGGLATRATAGYGKARSFLSAVMGLFFTSSANQCVTGGGGGGGGTVGNGGGGGGVVLVATPTLTNNGTIRALGANGAGGGGGGGGGVVFLAYGTKSGTGSVSVAGGTGNVAGATGTIVEATI